MTPSSSSPGPAPACLVPKRTRAQAADYLTDRGYPISKHQLAKLAAQKFGTGPRYIRWGNRSLYEERDLDAWADSRARAVGES